MIDSAENTCSNLAEIYPSIIHLNRNLFDVKLKSHLHICQDLSFIEFCS